MGISPEKLEKILRGNASTLCSPAAQEAISKLGTGGLNESLMLEKNSNPDTYYNETNYYDDTHEYNDTMSYIPPMNESSYGLSNDNYNPEAIKNSKLPDKIKESLIKHPIRTNTTVSDMLSENNAEVNQKFSNLVKNIKKENINEQVISQPNNTAAIDYNYIKFIVTECIKEALKSQPINEGTSLKQIGLSEGKIKLVDNKGNIFSAKLEYDGNIKDKKRSN